MITVMLRTASGTVWNLGWFWNKLEPPPPLPSPSCEELRLSTLLPHYLQPDERVTHDMAQPHLQNALKGRSIVFRFSVLPGSAPFLFLALW
mmetsp:Transcript_16962/g.46953  ORF Transcript_16962/g.46953 Transcript_16962/m.46953 type:complete len:91 (+) Transcript_16962:500-772(+)